MYNCLVIHLKFIKTNEKNWCWEYIWKDGNKNIYIYELHLVEFKTN